MIECNIYSGRRGRLDYQETATDNIPYDERVGVMYL